MSVLVKVLNMPNCCAECYFWNGICGLEGSGKTEDIYNERGDCCPLVEVPDYAVIWGTKSDGVPVLMFLQPENKGENDEHTD